MTCSSFLKVGFVVRGRIISNTRVFSLRRIVKAIRLNLLLPWVQENFPKLRKVILIRHPLAVAISAIRKGFTVPDIEEIYLSQHPLVASLNLNGISKVPLGQTDVEKWIIAWCIETSTLLTTKVLPGVKFVFYEDIFDESLRELRNVFEEMRLVWNEDLVRRTMQRPAFSSRGGSVASRIREPSEYWSAEISKRVCEFG